VIGVNFNLFAVSGFVKHLKERIFWVSRFFLLSKLKIMNGYQYMKQNCNCSQKNAEWNCKNTQIILQERAETFWKTGG